MKMRAFFIITLVLSVTAPLIAQGLPAPPLTENEVIEILKSKDRRTQAPAIVEQRGVDFELTPEIEKKLRKARGDDPFIEIVKKATPSARAAQAAAQGGITFTPEEAQAMQAVQGELDPDRTIQLTTEFAQKYPNSPFLTLVYTYAASAYQQKGDIDKVLEFGEKSLQLNDNNLLSLLIMAAMLPQPQALSSGDPEKKLAQAEEYANRALKLIEDLPQQPDETEEQLKSRKAQLAKEPHSALGMVHLSRAQQGLQGMDPAELQKAEEEYQLAVTITDRPNPQDFFRLGETRERLKKYDAAIEAYTKAGELGQGTVIKEYADQRIEALRKAEGQGPAPTEPAKP